MMMMVKKILLSAIIFTASMSLIGCNFSQKEVVENNDIKTRTEGFLEPHSTDWVKYIQPVREYMYYRTSAVLQNDISILWERYPKLKNNMNPEIGINIEMEQVQSLNDHFHLIDANFSEEGRERIKVKEINDHEVIVLVHGGIGYLRDNFEESGGEILIKLYMERARNQWNMVKTDEYLLHEYKEWIKNN
jgi:hypothetical protein